MLLTTVFSATSQNSTGNFNAHEILDKIKHLKEYDDIRKLWATSIEIVNDSTSNFATATISEIFEYNKSPKKLYTIKYNKAQKKIISIRKED
jgi:hypothetical protein